MATHRPNVAVYQEFRNVTFTPATPTLHTLVVGPCVQILDYLDDKDDCYADADYGTLEANNPTPSPAAVLITEAPNMKPGAKLNSDSVGVYLDEGRAVMNEWTGVGDNATFLSGDNLFKANNGAGIGVHFGLAGVAAGDRLVVQPLAPATDDYKMTIKELAYTLYNAGLLFLTAGVTGGDTAVIYNDTAPTSRNGSYTVKRVLGETTLELNDTSVLKGATANCNLKIVSPSGTVKMDAPVVGLMDACYMRMTADFTTANDAANRRWRVERAFSDMKLATTDYTIGSDDSITLDAGITVDLSSTLTAKKVTYGKIYIEYTALRRDLQQINEVSQDTTSLDLLGKYDARNPLRVGAQLAALNTLTTVKTFGLKSDDLTGYMDFVAKISSERKVYAVVPLTFETSVLGFLNTMAITLADPTYVLTNGIRQKFRAVIGAIDLPIFKYVIDPINSSFTSQKLGTAPAIKGRRTLAMAGVGGVVPAPAFITADGVIPGDKVVFTDGGGVNNYSYTIAHVKTDGSIEVNPDEGTQFPVAFALADTDTFAITDAAGLVFRYGPVTYNSLALPPDVWTLTPSLLDDLYLIVTVPGAHFVTDGVLPGDVLQLPHQPDVNDFDTTAPNSWVIDDVLSETRIQVVNAGNDTSTVENELPHEGFRDGGSVVNQNHLYVRVIRNFTKAQQVTEMLATAHSFSSRRLVLCFPDLVDVVDLKDGSLPRTSDDEPADADPQPGYYLSCCVGGQTAGQPSQQGFTFLGVNGISRIYNSNDYFSEEQLTELSNGGIYVFTQESLASLPSTIHEVTTDVSTLEFSEYMILKNFDYIAWTFLDVLLEFIGRWNVTEETIQFIGQAEQATIGTLKSDRKPKIGAPLIDATIISNEISDISSDRVESYIDVSMPMTLNIIGLHLVA